MDADTARRMVEDAGGFKAPVAAKLGVTMTELEFLLKATQNKPKKENGMETDIIKMGVDDAKEIANLVASGSLWTETIQEFSHQITRVNEETMRLGVDTPVGTAVFCSQFSIIEDLVRWVLLTAKEAVMKDTKQGERK